MGGGGGRLYPNFLVIAAAADVSVGDDVVVVVVVVVAKASSSSRASRPLTALLKSDELTWLFPEGLKLTLSLPCLQHRHSKIDQQKGQI